MPTLSKDLRNQLARATLEARSRAEAAARAALENLAVHEREPRGHMTVEQRKLRNQLRARGRALGDTRDERSGLQSITHLTEAAAYEQWHRLLFTRFLAENHLLIMPDDAGGSGVPVTVEECEELASELGARDGFELACRFASRTLPGVFRSDDPVLVLRLALNDEVELRRILDSLPGDIFPASDSLGWTYQFWQVDQKEIVNKSGNKIGADELPSVTQLFTEDYMVDFLLDNTLGAWHAGKVFSNQCSVFSCPTEADARKAVALPGCEWKYLRFVEKNSQEATEGTEKKNQSSVSSVSSCSKSWTPAAGTFDGWPKTAAELKCLDPCMGSGHFVVAMFERLVALRVAEEGLDEAAAVAAVIRDNLFGLEIDPRCTQIAAFNLALAAWRRLSAVPAQAGVGHCRLPGMHLACSGLAPNALKEDWQKLANGHADLRFAMGALYDLFQKAPVLGSLINPRRDKAVTYAATLHELQPLLEKALEREKTEETHELAVTAQGVAKAAEILAGQFTLVATNVPYLGRGNQDEVLQDYCERVHPEAKNDLATCFVERCLDFCSGSGSTSLVTPQNWFSQPRYEKLRTRLLTSNQWHGVARLGSGAFETIGGEVVTVSLVMLSNTKVAGDGLFVAWDVSDERTAALKAIGLVQNLVSQISQGSQLKNPDAIITLDSSGGKKLLNELARAWQGLVTGDDNRFYGVFWERAQLDGKVWSPVQQAPQTSIPFTGRETVARWENAKGDLHLRSKAHNFPPPSTLGKTGIAIQRMVSLNATIFSGDVFDDSVAPLIPENPENLPAVYAFCLSDEFKEAVRRINHQPKVIPGALTKVPFDLAHWQQVAAEKYPHGLPKPFSSDPTQWLFNGHPAGADQPLHVAVARLLGYQWPRQTGSSFPDCPALAPDGLETLADDDGIVCLPPLNREQPAAARLRSLLATALGPFDERGLLAKAGPKGSKSTKLEDWLRDEFFEQHCSLFHDRPFIWHIWDGLKDGFHALVHYHRLDHGLLQKLAYTYLGNWIHDQEADAKADKPGAAARLGAAQALQKQLAQILEGETPYDLFIRWKPLSQQPRGWHPDLNDGVRLNLRPFLQAQDVGKKGAGLLRSKPGVKWDKDRGKEPVRDKAGYPWFWCADEPGTDPVLGKEFTGNRWNDVHFTLARKRASH